MHSYDTSEDKWDTLEKCEYQCFRLAIVNDKLTTIGGGCGGTPTNKLLSYTSDKKWEQQLPSMPTAREWPAAVTTSTHLIVAGGEIMQKGQLPVVEILDTSNLQWFAVCNLPKSLECPNITICGEHLYLSRVSKFFSCSIEELLKSCKPASTNSSSSTVWKELANVPVSYNTNLVTLREQVLAIGGERQYGKPTGAIHRYDRSTNSWNLIGHMPTPHRRPLVAVLPSHELIAVGWIECNVTEIASSIIPSSVL